MIVQLSYIYVHILSIDWVTNVKCSAFHLGLETAKSLAKHGCEVILACRSSSRANEAIEEIKAIKATAIVEFVKLDLESLTSVKTCANEVLIKFRQVQMKTLCFIYIFLYIECVCTAPVRLLTLMYIYLLELWTT